LERLAMSRELDQVALRAKRAARGVSTVDDLLRERIAELEAAITKALDRADGQGMRDWPIFKNLRKALGR
jgi:hypothetical protein